MPIFDTSTLTPRTVLNPDVTSWIYNGLDCAVTFEVLERLLEDLRVEGNEVSYTYQMAMAKQAPFLEISMRGIRINLVDRDKAIAKMQVLLDGLEARFQRMMEEVFGHRMNWRSPMQLKTFFYGELNIGEIKKRNSKGVWAATVDEDALERIKLHPWGSVFASYILAMREIGKKITFLQTEIDLDGRIRCKLNVAGTNTGRLSSSASDFGTGTNLQNVDKTLRTPFIADPQYLLVETDLEQADARNVGAIIWTKYLSTHGAEKAGAYLDACESGDLHTTVARMSFPDLAWPELRTEWRAVADQLFLKGETYRDACKKLGHGTNYYGTPPTMAKNTGIPSHTVKEFQGRYFAAYPLIKQWQDDTIAEVRDYGVLTTIYGRKRHFFDRGNDQSTWRKAIAYCPQSMTGHQIDMGILNLWRTVPEVQLLMQVHDSILFQVPFHNHQTYVERAMEALRYEIELVGGRKFAVPLGCKSGYNWGSGGEDNVLGLKKWKGEETRVPPHVGPRRLRDML